MVSAWGTAGAQARSVQRSWLALVPSLARVGGSPVSSLTKTGAPFVDVEAPPRGRTRSAFPPTPRPMAERRLSAASPMPPAAGPGCRCIEHFRQQAMVPILRVPPPRPRPEEIDPDSLMRTGYSVLLCDAEDPDPVWWASTMKPGFQAGAGAPFLDAYPPPRGGNGVSSLTMSRLSA